MWAICRTNRQLLQKDGGKDKRIMREDAFSKLHPVILFFYFVVVLLVTMCSMHPLFWGIGFCAAFGYACILRGLRKAISALAKLFVLMLLIACLNALFQHGGVTCLFRLPGGNAVTAEALLYGWIAAGMLAAIFLWFGSYHQVITADKFLYLFGRTAPAMAMLLSMAMQFVPKFKRRIEAIAQAQEQIGRGNSQGSFRKKLHCGKRIFSIAVTWALESGVVTADSMRSRGYGIGKRTHFSIYHFTKRDWLLLGEMVLLCTGIAVSFILGGAKINYYPAVKVTLNAMTVLGGICYGLFAMLPVWIDGKEAWLWRRLRSNI